MLYVVKVLLCLYLENTVHDEKLVQHEENMSASCRVMFLFKLSNVFSDTELFLVGWLWGILPSIQNTVILGWLGYRCFLSLEQSGRTNLAGFRDVKCWACDTVLVITYVHNWIHSYRVNHHAASPSQAKCNIMFHNVIFLLCLRHANYINCIQIFQLTILLLTEEV